MIQFNDDNFYLIITINNFEILDTIICATNLTQVSKAFNSLSKTSYNKHFESIHLYSPANDTERIIEDNTFNGITFDTFYGYKISKIASNAFNNTSKNITKFICLQCVLNQTQHEIEFIFNQMINLNYLVIGLNDTELPVLKLPKLEHLTIKSQQNLTVKSDVFRHLNQIWQIDFQLTAIKKVEKDAFKLKSTSNHTEIRISFSSCKLSVDLFQNGSFDVSTKFGLSKPIIILFDGANINSNSSYIGYLSEGAFKSVLNNELSLINLNDPQYHGGRFNSKLDCNDCKNFWLVKEKKDNQVKYAYCKDDALILFDIQIKDKLSQKCNYK